MSAENIACPICAKEFSALTIESHVSKCLFLTESIHDESPKSSKTSSFAGKSSITKRVPKSKSMRGGLQKHKNASPFSKEKQHTADNFSPEKKVGCIEVKKAVSECAPLAERMRPTNLSAYVGQTHILGPQTVLYQLLQKGEIPNVIFWGPPGCGKTSLANVIAHICKNNKDGNIRYVKLSAAAIGLADVKDVITTAGNLLKYGTRTIVFVDEIHRFNKTQQDVFLPHVESGVIILLGATTENPSFCINRALSSRCRIVVLEKLSVTNLVSILKTAVSSLEGILHISDSHAMEQTKALQTDSLTSASGNQVHLSILYTPKFIIDQDTIEWLANTCDGDARIALTGLEMAVQSAIAHKVVPEYGPVIIPLENIKDGLRKSHMLYDKKGDQHYDTISALHKSVRASDVNASLYWLTRMLVGGEDPMYIARRLVRMATEDIGLANPKALGIAVHTMHGCKMIGMPECDVLLAQCTTYLARSRKSRLMDEAIQAAKRVVNETSVQPYVPLELRNNTVQCIETPESTEKYIVDNKTNSGLLSYLPEGLENINFFK